VIVTTPGPVPVTFAVVLSLGCTVAIALLLVVHTTLAGTGFPDGPRTLAVAVVEAPTSSDVTGAVTVTVATGEVTVTRMLSLLKELIPLTSPVGTVAAIHAVPGAMAVSVTTFACEGDTSATAGLRDIQLGVNGWQAVGSVFGYGPDCSVVEDPATSEAEPGVMRGLSLVQGVCATSL
jgi:hypothetical protein